MAHFAAKTTIAKNLKDYTFRNKCPACEKVNVKRYPEETCQMEQVIKPYRVDIGVSGVAAIEVYDTHRTDGNKVKMLYKVLRDVFDVSAAHVLEGSMDLESSVICRGCSGNVPTKVTRPAKGGTLEEDTMTREKFVSMAFSPGNAVVLKGTAGSGKTTLLQKMCRANPDANILFLCYNKKLSEECAARFSRDMNVTASTIDSIWYRLYTGRIGCMGELLSSPWHFQHPEYLTKLFDGETELEDIPAAARRWVSDKIKSYDWWNFKRLAWDLFTHGKDELVEFFEGYDCVIVDEAQDLQPMTYRIISEIANPVVHVVYAGDTCQQLYGWNGAKNVLSCINAKKVYTLNRTFRFGTTMCSFVNAARTNDYTTVAGPEMSDTPVILDSCFRGYSHKVAYTYLFRSVARMVTVAQEMNRRVKIDFKKRKVALKAEKAAMFKCRREGRPVFMENITQTWLSKLSNVELDKLEILFDEMEDLPGPCVEFSTVHGMKGRQAEIVRVAMEVVGDEDVHITNVGLTRASRLLVLDT